MQTAAVFAQLRTPSKCGFDDVEAHCERISTTERWEGRDEQKDRGTN
jgi:hypothetical protein